jgi:hypothetical protein
MIILKEDTHTYHDTKNPDMKFISVTTLLGEYVPQFDEHHHAQRVADKNGLTKEEVLLEWKIIRDDANEYGTMVHAILERYLKAPKRIYSPRNDFEKKVIKAFRDVDMLESLDLIYNTDTKPEHIMSLPLKENFGLAGTSDIIEDIADFRFNVYDHKTNMKFTYGSQWNEYYRFPLEHLCHSKYNGYALQLSIYAYMYELETGRRFNRGGLFHWDRNAETFKLIPIPYMKKEAEALINHYRLNLN